MGIKELINKAYDYISQECNNINEYCNPCDNCKYNKNFNNSEETICEVIQKLYFKYNNIK